MPCQYIPIRFTIHTTKHTNIYNLTQYLPVLTCNFTDGLGLCQNHQVIITVWWTNSCYQQLLTTRRFRRYFAKQSMRQSSTFQCLHGTQLTTTRFRRCFARQSMRQSSTLHWAQLRRSLPPPQSL